MRTWVFTNWCVHCEQDLWRFALPGPALDDALTEDRDDVTPAVRELARLAVREIRRIRDQFPRDPTGWPLCPHCRWPLKNPDPGDRRRTWLEERWDIDPRPICPPG